MTKSSEKKILRNGFLITPFRSIPNGNLLIKDGKFSKVGKIQTNSSTPGTKVYDLQGNYMVPGFLDMHLHGGGGDVMDADLQSLEKMSKIHARHGTTSIVPTTTTAPLPKIEDALDIIEEHVSAQRTY
ncbi:hypothetical protein AKJ65_05415 [candidate division MSBL1 archaeon SCGC-AAA259E19]|uniref:Amidohydrolase-related domain-containing protein n=1 Tax=candidate division MSBL1 archaeon SCGC-AAA259E19 TaxID=1698264 RepID=A0A133UIP8_9EURY|nr:hypothetical protein AKJ65_05415 [candidate division MSBL1 archaeon SCGC-AAA259E19]